MTHQPRANSVRTLRPDLKTKSQLKKAIIQSVNHHHIWVNAFSLVNPSEQTYANIGRAVADFLTRRDALLPSLTGTLDSDPISDLSRLTPTLFMSINAS